MSSARSFKPTWDVGAGDLASDGRALSLSCVATLRRNCYSKTVSKCPRVPEGGIFERSLGGCGQITFASHSTSSQPLAPHRILAQVSALSMADECLIHPLELIEL